MLLPPAVCRAAPMPLQSGSAITREIHPNEFHLFELTLRAGELVGIEVYGGDLHFALRLVGPGGDTLQEVVHKRYGGLNWQFVVAGSGPHRLVLSSLEVSARPREYQLRVGQIRAATRHEKDGARAAAVFAEAEGLRGKWRSADLALASEKYRAAGDAWRRGGRWAEAAGAWQQLGEVHFIQSNYGAALGAFEEALRLSRRSADSFLTLTQLNNLGYVHIYLGDNEKAADLFGQARAQLGGTPPARTAARTRAEARLENNFGEVEYAHGKLKSSLERFARALALCAEVGDRHGVALARLNAGYSHLDSGSVKEAAREFEESLRLWREIGDRRGEALTLTARGNLYALLGDKHAAQSSHHEAREIFRRIGDRQGEAITSNGLGDVFEDLNLKQEAIDNYSVALRLNRDIGNKAFQAVSHYYLGRVYHDLHDFPLALHHYGESLTLSRGSGKSRMATHALMGIAAIRVRQQKFADALRIYQDCLDFYARINDLRRQALTRHGLGELWRAQGEPARALGEYRQGLELFRRIQDPQGEAESHYWLGRLLRGMGRLSEALAESERSIELIESQRARVLSQNWRSAYFASVHSHFELHIDILMQLHRQQPERGFVGLALQASERARARSLLDMLVETQGEIRRDVDASLLSRERELRRQLSAKVGYRIKALSAGLPASEVAESALEIRELNGEYNFVQAQIKAQSLAYAQLNEPQTLTVAEIQARLAEDRGTVLLEYLLGDERSYVWLVTPDAVVAEELPGRRELEALAGEVYQSLTGQRPGPGGDATAEEDFCSKATRLSQLILGPLSQVAGAERLLVIADGRLQYIPFDALPAPGVSGCRIGDEPPTYVPLLTTLEVVHLPSFSSLVLLRQLGPSAPRGARGIAVWADPVFESDDPRIVNFRAGARDAAAEPRPATRPMLERVDLAPSRLLSTQEEAASIMRFAPAGAVMLLTGFAASRESAVERDLQDYRILHFATHGQVNTRHPSLSGLLLSTFDEQGRSRNGLLQLHDIYGLRLNADLVVLSGCQTGLGEELLGEGLVGLTQGFLYAGSRSVVVSLWKVEDKTAATLMGTFYQAMLKDGDSPAVALRRAKLRMYQQGALRSPSHWSAFVIQGEFRPPPASWHSLLRSRRLWAGLVALAIIFWVMYSRVKRRGDAARPAAG